MNVSDKRLILYTDSQSAIREIQRHRSTCSPTVDKIYQTANRLTKESNIQFDIRWVPAHSGNPGSEAAHETAGCEMRRISSSPSTSAQSSQHATRPSDRSSEEYDPREWLRHKRNQRQKELKELWTPTYGPITEKVFRRKDMVLLHRIRTASAMTPRTIYRIELSTLRRIEPYAVPPDPSCERCKDSNSIPQLNHMILWGCSALAGQHEDVLGGLPLDERPMNMGQWTDATGVSERRTQILKSLLDYLPPHLEHLIISHPHRHPGRF